MGADIGRYSCTNKVAVVNWLDVLTKFVLPTLGGSAFIFTVIGAFIYWITQKSIDARFARGLEDYRHTHAAALQNEKLRLDLYDRRFEIFSSIFDFYEAMTGWEGTPEQKAARTRFFRAYQESGFLFTQASGIPDILKMLNDEAAKVIGYKENRDSYKSDPTFSREQFNQVTDIQIRVFDDGLAKLKAAMFPYLDFSKIETRP
jgi:hypothetical protein